MAFTEKDRKEAMSIRRTLRIGNAQKALVQVTSVEALRTFISYLSGGNRHDGESNFSKWEGG
jgi:hypothetical protein